MKFLFVAILIVLAIQLAASQTTTTTEAATTTTTTTTAATTATTTTTSSPNKIKCNRSNNWCHTRIPKKKCKNPKRCIKTVVVVTRRRG
ncbi:integumentary mucin C.1-like [Drosophila kikkawai]|uniref:Integumentary mucin C.1-like n=1 Tax=Drosophila kikkawai TaxID=30033 RepID=A0ABM3C8C2_DROKI|nr:integumentary mucin C.1-like [Drosophila kikkawai]